MENIFAFLVLIVWGLGLLTIVFFSGVFSSKGTQRYTKRIAILSNLLIAVRVAIFVSVPLQAHMLLWIISTLLMLCLDIIDYKYGRVNFKFVAPLSKK
jgi:sulfite exporter TauE/SafE